MTVTIRRELPRAAPDGLRYRLCACGNPIRYVVTLPDGTFSGLQCTWCDRIVDTEGWPLAAPREVPVGKGACTMWGAAVDA